MVLDRLFGFELLGSFRLKNGDSEKFSVALFVHNLSVNCTLVLVEQSQSAARRQIKSWNHVNELVVVLAFSAEHAQEIESVRELV